MATLNVMIQGTTYDLDVNDLDIGDISTDQEVRNAVASHLSIPVSKLALLRVDRNADTGDITMRPNAEFGSTVVRRNTAPALEMDERSAILNSLLTTPHRDLNKVYEFHANLIKSDPIFYQRLACWYENNGNVRDHSEMFVICLCLSDFEGHRDTGLALLRELPPYQVLRVIDYISGKYITKTTVTTVGKKKVFTKTKEKFGLFKNIPQSVKTEVTRYLHERENDVKFFDSAVVTARKAFKRLYALMRIKPSLRAQAILFDNNPPEDSTAYTIKQLVKLTDPTEQARLILDKKIPYRVASTVITAMSPTVLMALIEVMSPQELINNMASLNKRGVMDNPDLKKLVEGKLNSGKTNKRVSAVKALEAVKSANLSEDLSKKLEDVADTQVKSKGRIKASTAILVDKSGSMVQAIEIGKRLASLVSSIMDADYYVKVFDNASRSINKPANTDLASWEKAFAGTNAGGGTSCGASIMHLQKNNEKVDQIIMVTDEDEMTPTFERGLSEYQKFVGKPIRVIFLKVGLHKTKLEDICNKLGIENESYVFNGDYFSLPNLIPMLTKGSRLDLILDILDYPLKVRKTS